MVMITRTRKECFVNPCGSESLRALHCVWFAKVLKSIYVQYKFCHCIMMNVERICTGRANEWSVLNLATRIFSGIVRRKALSIETYWAPEHAVIILL